MPTTSSLTIATSTNVRLVLRVGDFTGYNRLQIWRSRLGEGGPFEEVTGSVAATALLLIGAVAPTQPLGPLTGKVLQFRVNDLYTYTVTFTGPDPLTRAQIATQIAAPGAGIVTASVNASNVIELRTVATGAAASIVVLGGDAAPLLQLSTTEPDSTVFGVDTRITLVSGTTVYDYTDPQGRTDWWYKTRFSNGAANSEFSPPFSGKTIASIDPAELIPGRLSLVHLDGRPLSNREIRIWSPFQYLKRSGKTVAGSEEAKVTDADGFVEFYLVRGAKVRVAISGTTLVREFTVPTDLAVLNFDLLDPALGPDDAFKIVIPTLDFAVRRN